MSRARWLFVMIFMASSLLAFGARAAGAQSPTAIAIPTATAEGCDQVPAYLETRQQIMDEFLVDLESVFPSVATPIMENGDQLFSAILTMTPEQAIALAQAYDAAAIKIAKVAVPPVAEFYNELQVQLYRLSADVFEEAGRSDLLAAGAMFEDQLVAIGNAVALAGAAATGVCPAFGDVVSSIKPKQDITCSNQHIRMRARYCAPNQDRPGHLVRAVLNARGKSRSEVEWTPTFRRTVLVVAGGALPDD